MIFIHQNSCISPQTSFPVARLEQLAASVNNKLIVIEPDYSGIPPGILRRMGKAVRMAVGSALPLLKAGPELGGIIIGTANGGMEDCIKFLNQIIEYDEGLLTPGNFVQSTPNAIASQIGLLQSNRAYNITHVHRGLAFENAVLDAEMLVQDHPTQTYLLGAVDEISSYNFNIDFLGGWYKKEIVANSELYQSHTAASIAGEGTAMFLVNGISEGAHAKLDAISLIHTDSQEQVAQRLKDFIKKQGSRGKKIDLLISGENGDNRLINFYTAAEAIMDSSTTLARFKHMSGEYPTASSMACWLACHILESQELPTHMVKRQSETKEYQQILIYNNYKGAQHCFMLLSKP
jgi:hypothetical protein